MKAVHLLRRGGPNFRATENETYCKIALHRGDRLTRVQWVRSDTNYEAQTVEHLPLATCRKCLSSPLLGGLRARSRRSKP